MNTKIALEHASSVFNLRADIFEFSYLFHIGYARAPIFNLLKTVYSVTE